VKKKTTKEKSIIACPKEGETGKERLKNKTFNVVTFTIQITIRFRDIERKNKEKE